MTARRSAVVTRVDAFGHQFQCNVCGELPGGPNLEAAKARARRHAAANPDHEVQMVHVTHTHFVAVEREAGQ